MLSFQSVWSGMNYVAVVGTLMLVVFFQLGPGKKGCSKEPNAKMLGVGGGGQQVVFWS